MALFKCKMCGGELDVQEGVSVLEYKLVFEKDISDYSLIDKTSSVYETVKTALPIDPNLDIDLYYKKSNVYVQNHLRGGNAIYVLDPSMDKDEKVKNNRLALLNELKNKYIMLTDFSKLNV